MEFILGEGRSDLPFGGEGNDLVDGGAIKIAILEEDLDLGHSDFLVI